MKETQFTDVSHSLNPPVKIDPCHNIVYINRNLEDKDKLKFSWVDSSFMTPLKDLNWQDRFDYFCCTSRHLCELISDDSTNKRT